MKRSDLNHLRRLVAWVQCEIGQSPEDLVATTRTIAEKLGNPELDHDAQVRMVQAFDHSRAVPGYLRAAVKALDRYARAPGAVVDVKVRQRKTSGRPLLVQRKQAGGPPP